MGQGDTAATLASLEEALDSADSALSVRDGYTDAAGDWYWKDLRLDAPANRLANRALVRHFVLPRTSLARIRYVERDVPGAMLVSDDALGTYIGPDLFKEQVALALKLNPEADARSVVSRVSARRFTFTVEAGDYTPAVHTVRKEMRARGYKELETRNYWNHPGMQHGVHTLWYDPVTVLPVQVHIHTPQSFLASQVNETIKAVQDEFPAMSDDERLSFHDRGGAMYLTGPNPPGVDSIKDYERRKR